MIKRGKCIDQLRFQVAGEIIPSIQKELLKTLGWVCNSSVTDRQAEDDLKKKIKELVQKIDKSLLAGIMKVWGYQNLLLAIIGWPLMIYEIPLSWVESVETYLNEYLRKWLGFSENMSHLSLYYDETPCPFKKRRVGGLLQLQQSEDQSVRDNVPELYGGRMWKVAVEASNIDSKRKMPKGYG